MKVSTKGRYALRVMLDLAINNTGEYIPLKEVSRRQGITLKYLYEFKVPRKIQGITFRKINDTPHMILSSSYGRKNNSKVLIFPISKTNTYLNPTYSFCCPPMLEQISVDNNNDILFLFESSSSKYRKTAKTVTDKVTFINLEKLKN